ncbi:uncharacterized protein N0V89_004788 [Didymosphaeria variabile]|uniref:C2H2-type domain-containing protein n=1 Tax=Didymosphaeria variabile TaxID=1932322 RepID=A0A9W8XR20_9PLEO|nr:uncharacterized protein N0V89_004788 [Didymosphaeria variabile]KAJ4356752.1 hypothetical protein N0V89_004788 [Didymosphaeria variabile]
MAAVAGFVASIAQIASAGIRLSSVLYDAASGDAHTQQEVADIADDVKTTAIALDGVGRIIGEDVAHDVSRTALSEAGDLAKRCEAVFGDVQEFIEKGNNPGQDEKKTSRAHDQSKEQRTEVLRRRLDSLKHSNLLLLHVLQLANAQAKGNVDNNLIAQERESIRELHQRQQDSLKALQALETKFGDVLFSDDETLNGSAAPSRVPTINFLVHSSARGVSSDGKASGLARSTVQAPSALSDKPETSDSDNSDETVTDDDEDLTVNDLAHCATHVQKLLKRITALQRSCEIGNVQSSRGRFPRNKVLKLYRRFCRKFESEMASHTSATPTVAPLPNVSFPYQYHQRVQPHETTRDSHPQNQHTPGALPGPSGTPADRTSLQTHSQSQQNSTHTARPVVEAQYAPAPPAWIISSEPLGPGSRPKLPPLASSIPAVPHASHASPTSEMMSPADDHDAKYSGTDGDGEHGSHENGPVVYTKTGRISKAKKGLKVHVCEECGRSFTRAEHLRRHQKNHGPNQVRCELCGKVFFRADLLQRHLERHKDLPQGYRFSNVPAPDTEGASPVADDQHHRHILPAPGNAVPGIPHHSPGGRSVNSSGASGAPTPSEVPAASPAVTSRAHAAWDTARTQTVAPLVQEEMTPQRTHGWQTVNAQERKHSETAQTHASSAALQQSHPGLPKLQPKPDTANGASTHRRYSNILPAPGAGNAPHQPAAYPQEHTPNMLPARHQLPPIVTGSRPSPFRQDGHLISHSPAASTIPAPGPAAHLDHSNTSRSVPPNTLGRPNIESGNISSDREGVNWRLAETDAQSYRKRKHYRTVSQTDGDSSGFEDRGNGHAAHRTPDILGRSRSGSRSLSLVMPQDDRDHALLGSSRPENRQRPEIISPHGGPPLIALSPSLAEKRSPSRPSTAVSDSANIQASSAKPASGPESPEPESPYSLATINRYIQNQGPQPGVQDLASDVSPKISMNPCERCREYSIKCDGKIPSCTACATTKYAGECSFAGMAAYPAHLGGANPGIAGPKFYEGIGVEGDGSGAESGGEQRQQQHLQAGVPVAQQGGSTTVKKKRSCRARI